MTDYALIYQRTENGTDVYYRYDLEDSKTRLNKLGEIRFKTDINDRIAEDWGEQKQA